MVEATRERRVYDVVSENLSNGKLTIQTDDSITSIAILKVLCANLELRAGTIAKHLEGSHGISTNGNVIAWRMAKYLCANGLVYGYDGGKKGFYYHITNIGRDCLTLIETGNDFYRVLKVGRILSGKEV